MSSFRLLGLTPDELTLARRLYGAETEHLLLRLETALRPTLESTLAVRSWLDRYHPVLADRPLGLLQRGELPALLQYLVRLEERLA